MEGLNLANAKPHLAVPKISYVAFAPGDFDRCASLASLYPPPAALGEAARAGTVARIQIQLLQYKRMTPILTEGVILSYGEGGI